MIAKISRFAENMKKKITQFRPQKLNDLQFELIGDKAAVKVFNKEEEIKYWNHYTRIWITKRNLWYPKFRPLKKRLKKVVVFYQKSVNYLKVLLGELFMEKYLFKPFQTYNIIWEIFYIIF